MGCADAIETPVTPADGTFSEPVLRVCGHVHASWVLEYLHVCVSVLGFRVWMVSMCLTALLPPSLPPPRTQTHPRFSATAAITPATVCGTRYLCLLLPAIHRQRRIQGTFLCCMLMTHSLRAAC